MKLRICLILSLLLFCLLLPGSIFAAENLSFVHQDHLGSTILITDSTGKLISKQVYYPFGETRNEVSEVGYQVTNRQYTGQVSDQDETGLYYYNARYYDPKIAKFTQADTLNVSPNRYTYAQNNPLRYTDPSGKVDWDMLGEDLSDIYPAWTNYQIDFLHRQSRLLSDILSEPDDLLENFDENNEELFVLNSPANIEIPKEPDAKTRIEKQSSNPYIVSPQSSVSVDLDPGGANGSNTLTITIKVIPNSEVNVAIDPFMKIILPRGMRKISSFSSNQAGWGQIYYDEANTFVIDNYNISFGNNFELSFQVDVSRKSLSGIIRIETWSDLYNFDESHDQIRQTVDKIPLSTRNRNK